MNTEPTREGVAATAWEKLGERLRRERAAAGRAPAPATHPDSEGVRPLTIEEVGKVVLVRIKTAFAPVDDIDDPETQRKAEWVVEGIEKWGQIESSGPDTSVAGVDGAAQ